MLRDESPQVTKRVIQGLAAIYKNFLQWICTLGDISDETKEAWDAMSIMKAEIVDMIDNFNDGIRTNGMNRTFMNFFCSFMSIIPFSFLFK